jgi:hypothetical protein
MGGWSSPSSAEKHSVLERLAQAKAVFVGLE